MDWRKLNPWRKSAGGEYRIPDALLPPIPWQQASGAELATAGACVDLIGRCLAMGRASPPFDRALTPSLLARAGRDLAAFGASLWLPAENGILGGLAASGGDLQLVPAADYEITGGSALPAEWRYQVSYSVPDGTRTRKTAGANVLHFRCRQDRRAPWRGRPALEDGPATGRLAGGLDQTLAHEARTPALWSVSLGDGNAAPDSDQLKSIKGDMDRVRKTDGVLVMAGPLAANRIGAAPHASLVTLRAQMASEIAGLFGVPRALLSEAAPGQAQREGLRRFAHTTLAPMAAVIAAEVTEKTGIACEISLDRLFAADVTARARAYKGLVDSGVAADAAARIVGFESLA